jgi:3-oxoacyl-[acyl-carrier protein] reductase
MRLNFNVFFCINFQIKEIMKFQIPFGEFGEPEDIAEAAAFLLSKKAKYISGTTLSVNGALYN